VNPGFREKMEVTRVPLGRPSRTTSGTCTTGWDLWFKPSLLHLSGRNCGSRIQSWAHLISFATHITYRNVSRNHLCLIFRNPWNARMFWFWLPATAF